MFRFILVLTATVLLTAGANAKETFKELKDFEYVTSTGILQGMLAKELCSCRYVVGVPMNECQDRSPLPGIAFSIMLIVDNLQQKTVTVYPGVPFSKVPAMATFNRAEPRKGCRLVFGMREAMESGQY